MVKKSEPKWTSVTSNEIATADFRLEASYFNIEAKKARQVINQSWCPLLPISGKMWFWDAFQANRFKRIYVNSSEYPIFSPSQILDVNPKPTAYISKKTETDIDDLRANFGQILITRSGTIGKCTMVTKTLEWKIFSDDLIRIEAKKRADIGYLYAFLQSHTGQLLLTTSNYGAVIQHIDPEHLGEINIPNPSEKIKEEIGNKILLSFEKRDASNILLREAEEILIKELSLPPISKLNLRLFDSSSGVGSFTVSSSELADRFDWSYHDPVANAISRAINSEWVEIALLGDSHLTEQIFLPGRFKRIYVEEDYGRVFFWGKQIHEINPSGKKYLSLSLHKDRLAKELLLKKNMILVTRSGTIWKVNIVPSHWENWVANDHILRVVPANDKIAGYLYVWLNSEYWERLIKRFTYGAVVDEIEPEHLSELLVPILKNKETLEKINGLALRANDLRTEAYSLEEEAINELNSEVLQLGQ